MSTVAFAPLTAAETAFKTIVWTPLIQAGELYLDGLQAAIPVLDVSFIQDLEADALNALTDYIFNVIVMTIDVTAIQLVKPEQQAAWQTASAKLEILAQEQGVNSSAYQQALSDSAAAFAKFVHSGP
eukprot:gnl/Spiro4/8886_TR4690_c0_g1_i1.p5 gnl/Spiro4/8886_TR4690_c0_g1~~gnl/Spiro4/8886_TR4690_c0_g1_i1.p5  ORF type:complete len:127 (-),score=14.58 gnl/Spiro4/8886_TR4690_c0_g1_i1:1652-2032(-)